MPIRILIADPDRSLLASYRESLSHDGFEVVTATNGLECVDKLRTSQPDVLVLEPEMPWGGGDGVLAMMQEGFDVPLVPVMIVTSRQDPNALYEVMAFPMVTHYQAKPLAPDQLEKLVLRILDDPPPEIEPRTQPLKGSGSTKVARQSPVRRRSASVGAFP